MKVFVPECNDEDKEKCLERLKYGGIENPIFHNTQLDVIFQSVSPLIVCGNEVVFKKRNIIPTTLDLLPDDWFLAVWDFSGIEVYDATWLSEKTSGWYRLDSKDIKVNGCDCYAIAEPWRVESLYLNYNEYPTYLWLAPACFSQNEALSFFG